MSPLPYDLIFHFGFYLCYTNLSRLKVDVLTEGVPSDYYRQAIKIHANIFHWEAKNLTGFVLSFI